MSPATPATPATATATTPATATATTPATAAGTTAAPPAGATWPCGSCQHRNDLAASVCAGCGTGFLAAARDERPALVLPLVGDLAALPPVRRVGVAVVVLVAVLLATALLALLLA
jgi:hypothetical protein